ncbi:Dolichol kinase [Persephonella hydrogeniphila]|uniref:Dolichol kinase n=1 Tax=Persephonella hydrogeniphila TaxID=198703 RepID=A0A285N3H9_9AQUI|nr:hypothetical protein [Persephonella hydrogeniphila]SNZ02301.1 Dolichol kinase [Persephonella hydrogeniphila]
MRNLRVEIPRKLFHILSILSLLIPLYLFGKFSISVLMGLMVLFLLPVSYLKIKNSLTSWYWKIIQLVEREENIKKLPARQAFSLATGMFISSVIFDVKILQICIVSTAVYDGVATIVGLLWGKHRLPNGKSVEGSIAGVVLNTVFLLPFTDLFYSLLVSFFTSVIENISDSKKWYLDDNLLIPIGVGIFCTVLDIPAKLPQFFFTFS